MFLELYSIPYDRKEGKRLRERWETKRGIVEQKYIIEKIKKGAGEHLLESDYENERLATIESESDLKGMEFSFLDITFPNADNFKGIDFSYSKFTRCIFKNATFLNVNIDFCQILACKFIKCNFLYFNGVGSVIRSTEFIDCTFEDSNSLRNFLFNNVEFTSPFFREQIFYNCKFINGTSLNNIPLYKPHIFAKDDEYDRAPLAFIFSGIKDGFKHGQNRKEAIKYYLLEQNHLRRYNTNSYKQKISRWLNEKLIGYGFKPINAFLFIIICFLITTLIQSFLLGFNEKIVIFTAGSFFTFGDITGMLKDAPLLSKFFYILGSFSGIGSIALFITILANYFFGEIP